MLLWKWLAKGYYHFFSSPNLLDSHQPDARQERHGHKQLPEVNVLQHGQASDIRMMRLQGHIVQEIVIQGIKRWSDIGFRHQRGCFVRVVRVYCWAVV